MCAPAAHPGDSALCLATPLASTRASQCGGSLRSRTPLISPFVRRAVLSTALDGRLAAVEIVIIAKAPTGAAELGHFTINGIAPLPVGIPRIRVDLQLLSITSGSNGLRVKAFDEANPRGKKIWLGDVPRKP